VTDLAGFAVVASGLRRSRRSPWPASADGRTARFATGTNGALAAFNVLLNTYAAGDACHGL